MDNDDRPVGRILSRREVLALFGAAGVTALVGCAAPQASPTTQQVATDSPTEVPTPPQATQAPATDVAVMEAPTLAATLEPTLAATQAASADGLASVPACVVSPEMTEGPYFVDEKLNRSDIRANTSDGAVKEGAPLVLRLRVSSVANGSCALLPGAMVDIWHCDALGVYSDAQDRSFDTVGQDFLRGYQITDANGVAQFTTIYPGWYPGRAVHIHFKVRGANASGQNYEFTSQFFFDEALSEQVFAQAPYSDKGQGFLRNANDGIYRGGGDQTTLVLTPSDAGFTSTFDIGMQI
jgi:protocatechuate 3,4-dioxygenase beta subunit